ncbi:MAG TPA: sigma-70 family RNA polymerase sigma factor [Pirellulales bacterium]|nr:sigma-70 family RNA polymerase sigma factor [Pirellulales bacterium]
MPDSSDDTKELLCRIGQGDQRALGALFNRHRARLRRMVELRMHRKLHGRLDPSDVLQEAYFWVSRSVADYLRNPNIPFYLWLRFITARRLQHLHRHHLGTKMRDAGMEISLQRGALPQVSSASLAAQLLGRLSTPSHAAMRAELQLRVQEGLNRMTPLDREIIALRHFEQVSNSEAAQILGITEAGASNRFIRALKRLKQILTDVTPGMTLPEVLPPTDSTP